MKLNSRLAKLSAVTLLTFFSASSVMGVVMTYTVNTNGDNADSNPGDGYCGQQVSLPGGQPSPVANTCSLRAAIQEANANVGVDTIDLTQLSTNQRTITLTSNLAAITEPVLILGAGVTLDGNGNLAAFQFTPAATGTDRSAGNSEITGLTITGASTTATTGGAGIYFGPSFPSKLTLNSVTLSSNTASAGPGGAVAISDGNALVINGGSLTGNTALRGGAISVLTDVRGPSGVVDNNLSNTADDVLTLTGVTLTGNTASAGNGGAVLADLRNGGDIVIRNSTVGSGTAAGTRNTASGDGGALWVIAALTNSDLLVSKTAITNNRAGNGAGVAIKRGRIQLRDSTLSSNVASAAGGGVYLDANVANVNGGSLYAENVTFSDNTATTQGGAIAAHADNPAASAMIHSTLAGNIAAANMGGGLSVAAAPNNTFPGDFSNPFTSNIFANTTGGNCRSKFAHLDANNSGFQISSDASCGFTQSSDRESTDPKIAALALNAPSGVVQTRKLLVGSPAIDAGNSNWVNSKDARDADAQDGGADGDLSNGPERRDIGAHEFGGFGVVEFKFATPATGFSVDEDQSPAQVFIGRYGRGTAANSLPSVTLASSNGTATAGSDYTAVSGADATVSFTADGDTQFQVLRNIAVANDSISEGDETFNLTLSAPNPSYVDLGQRATAVITIRDAENGTFQFDPITVNATEGPGATAVATITRTVGSKGRVRVSYATADDTCTPAASCRATAGSDYTAVTDGTLVFEAGETSKTIAINLTNDSIAEPAEKFRINLTAVACVDAVNAVLAAPKCDAILTATTANRTATVTVADDDGASTLSINSLQINEGNSGNTPFTFTVSLSPVSSQTVTVSYATANGTATTADNDYTAVAATTLTFAPGDSSKTVTVNAIGDTRFETDETFFVNLSNATGGATIGTAQGVGTILNDEDTPAQGVISFEADCDGQASVCATQSATETGTNAGGLKTATFAVKRSGNNATSSTVSVNFAVTTPGYSTFVAGTNPAACTFDAASSDYRITATGAGTSPNNTAVVLNSDGTGTITFNNAGASTATISVQVCNDTRRESLQLLDITLSNASNNAALGTTKARLSTTSDELPRYQLAQPTLTVREGADLFASLRVDALDVLDGEQVCVPYKTMDGPAGPNGAVSPADYTAVDTSADACGGALAYTNGQGDSRTISVMIVDDGAAPVEQNETFTFQLLPPVGSAMLVSGADVTTVTIVNQPRIYFTARNIISTDEASGREMVFTLTREGDTSNSSTVQYQISSDTATGKAEFGTDFTTPSGSQTGTVAFAANATTATIRTTVIADSLIEGDETFTVTLSNPSGAVLAADSESTPRVATGTITDDDFRFEFSSASTSVNEGDGHAVLTINRVGRSLAAATVDVSLVAGTATAGTDYTTPASGTVSFDAGKDGSKTFSIPITDDALDEADETLTATLVNPSSGGALGTPGSNALTIVDNDDAPTLRIGSASITEGDVGEKTLTFTATLSAVSGKTVMATATTANGTATAGSDYTSNTQMLMFTPGQTTQTFDVTIQGDTLAESDETFTVTLSNPSNATFADPADARATGTIINDDASPSVTLSLSGSPFAENGGVATLTATLSAPSGQDVTVNLAYSGSATLGSDYTAASSIVIPAGTAGNSASIPVTGIDDPLDEFDEQVVVEIDTVTNGTENGTQSVTATIIDDDAPPTVTLSLTGSPFTEKGGVATLTATLSAPSGKSVTVMLAYSGTATRGADYSAADRIVIPAGATGNAASIAITGIDDATDEPDETVIVDIDSVINGSENGTQKVSAVIADDDDAISLSVADASVSEGSNGAPTQMRFTVSVNSASAQNVSVRYATSNGTAIAGQDYTASNGILTIPAGQTSAALTVPVTADNDDEADETFTVTLSTPVNATISRAQAVGTILDDDTSPATVSVNDSRGRSVSFSTSAGGFDSVSSTGQPANAPSSLVYDNGFFTYTIVGLTVGGSTTVTATLPNGNSASTYVNCPADCFNSGSGSGNTVQVTLVDGGPGDADGVANGRIVVKAGAGGREVTGGTGGGGGGSLGGSALSMLALLWALRRRFAMA